MNSAAPGIHLPQFVNRMLRNIPDSTAGIAQSAWRLRVGLSLFAILLTIGPAAAPTRAAAPGAGTTERTIAGTVRDVLGRPIAGVELELQSVSGKTVARSVPIDGATFHF
jgi:hypothetical protein